VKDRVTPSANPKCERCWHWRADVGSDRAHPTLCGRCVANLFGSGEPRNAMPDARRHDARTPRRMVAWLVLAAP
jgi:hypothetical protein